MTGTEVTVHWRGTPARLFTGLSVRDFGDDKRELVQSMYGALVVGVDPGDPTGVCVIPYDRGYPIGLHTVSPEDLAEAIHCSSAYDVICETPLHGAVRVFDPWPWKVRGFLELTMKQSARSEHEFVCAHTGWLKGGRRMATVVGLSHEHRHAKDALAYVAMAVTQSPRVRHHCAEHLGDDNG